MASVSATSLWMNDDYDGGQANEPVSYSIKLSCALHKVIKKEIVSEKTPDAVGYVKIPSKNMTSNIVLFFLKLVVISVI